MFIKKVLLFLTPSSFQLGKRRDSIVSSEQLPADIDTQKRLLAEVQLWCIANRFLILDEAGTRNVPNIATSDMNTGLFNHIYVLNLKQLCNRSHLHELLLMMRDTEHDATTSRLIDLHIQLTTELDPRYLNLYINRLVHALTTVYPDENADLNWVDIFTDYPYLWLLFPIQRIMRQTTPPPEV